LAQTSSKHSSPQDFEGEAMRARSKHRLLAKGDALATAGAAVGLALSMSSLSGSVAFTAGALAPPHAKLASLRDAAPRPVPGVQGDAGKWAAQRCVLGSAVLLVLAAVRPLVQRKAKRNATTCQVALQATPLSSLETVPLPIAPKPVVHEPVVQVTNLIDFSPSATVVARATPTVFQVATAACVQERDDAAPFVKGDFASARKPRAARRAGGARRPSRQARSGATRHAAAAAAGAHQEHRHVGAKLQHLPPVHWKEFSLRYDSSLKTSALQLGLRTDTTNPAITGMDAKIPQVKAASLWTGVIDIRGNTLFEKHRMVDGERFLRLRLCSWAGSDLLVTLLHWHG